jgi:hypothetical protein
MYAIALVASITRMNVGVRYRRDVLAGTVLGSALGLLRVLADGFTLNGIGKNTPG